MQLRLWAYAVMPDQIHVLLYPRDKIYDIADIRKEIKKLFSDEVFKLYPQWRKIMFVRKTRGVETRIWQQGGGYDRNMFTPEVIRAAIDYIHNNPEGLDVARAMVTKG